MFVLIDNYDSFTYNVYQYMSELTDKEIRVFRNDRVTVEELEELDLDGIIISPGPGRPEDAGISVEVVRRFAGKTPILGICLGHQVLGSAFGAEIIQAKNIVHGKTDSITLDAKGLNIPILKCPECVGPFSEFHRKIGIPFSNLISITAHN